MLALAFLLAVSASAVAAGETVLPESAPYSIDTPYSYPVVPGTEEWGERKNLYAKIKACQVPEAILDNRTTEALFQTVLDYPFTFYSTSSSNNVWIEGDQAEVFTWDGSFDEGTPGRSGDKVWYSPAHSGIYQYKSGDTVYVRSKWRAFGLYEHAVNDCPWPPAGVTYYR